MLSVALNGVIQGCHQASPASNDFIYTTVYIINHIAGGGETEMKTDV